MYVAFPHTQKAFDSVETRLDGQTTSTRCNRISVDSDRYMSYKYIMLCCRESDKLGLVSSFSRCQIRRILSTFLYLVFITVLLQNLKNVSPNVGILSVNSSNPTLADDIVCVALSPQWIQTLLNMAINVLPAGDSDSTPKNLTLSDSLLQN